MADPVVFKFYNFFDAHLAKHQLEEDGHRAEVYGFIYSGAQMTDPWVQLIVFKDGMEGDLDPRGGERYQFGAWHSGSLALTVDAILRTVAMVGMCMVPIGGIYILANQPVKFTPLQLEVFFGIVLALPLSIPFMVATVAIYEDYRRDGDFGVLVISLAGWVTFVLWSDLFWIAYWLMAKLGGGRDFLYY